MEDCQWHMRNYLKLIGCSLIGFRNINWEIHRVHKFLGNLQSIMGSCDRWEFSLFFFFFNNLRPRKNGRHFPDDIFNSIFLNENAWTPIKFSLKFVPKGPIDNIPALVQIMAGRRLGGKLLSEPMIVRLPTHICVTRPQWVKDHWQIPCRWGCPRAHL